MLPLKREVIEQAVLKGATSIMLDARQLGVEVPGPYRVKDLVVELRAEVSTFSDLGVRAQVKLEGAEWFIFAPWGAVYGSHAFAIPETNLWDPPPSPPRLSVRLGHLGVVE